MNAYGQGHWMRKRSNLSSWEPSLCAPPAAAHAHSGAPDLATQAGDSKKRSMCCALRNTFHIKCSQSALYMCTSCSFIGDGFDCAEPAVPCVHSAQRRCRNSGRKAWSTSCQGIATMGSGLGCKHCPTRYGVSVKTRKQRSCPAAHGPGVRCGADNAQPARAML